MLENLGQWASALSYTLELSEDMLQDHLEGFFPLHFEKLYTEVTLSNPTIKLRQNSECIAFSCAISVQPPGRIRAKGQIMLEGQLRYDSFEGQFFIDDIQVIGLEIARIPKALLPGIRHIAQIALSSLLAGRAIYKLKDNDKKHRLAKSALRAIRVKNRTLQLQFGARKF